MDLHQNNNVTKAILCVLHTDMSNTDMSNSFINDKFIQNYQNLSVNNWKSVFVSYFLMPQSLSHHTLLYPIHTPLKMYLYIIMCP